MGIAISMLEDLYTKVHFSIKYGDKTSQVLGQVDLVKGKMQDNITNIIQNTETAEDMAIKSDQLNEQAAVFKKKSTDLRKQMQWKNLKMTIIFGTFIILIILALTIPLVVKRKELTGSK